MSEVILVWIYTAVLWMSELILWVSEIILLYFGFLNLNRWVFWTYTLGVWTCTDVTWASELFVGPGTIAPSPSAGDEGGAPGKTLHTTCKNETRQQYGLTCLMTPKGSADDWSLAELHTLSNINAWALVLRIGEIIFWFTSLCQLIMLRCMGVVSILQC